MNPTLDGFTCFIRDNMQIPNMVLPDSSSSICMAYRIALDIVNTSLSLASSDIYTLAVYNLGGDFLINYAHDVNGQTYFADLRASFKIYSFVPGVISDSHDVSTGQSLLNSEFMKNLTMSDLQNLKTPYGRQYLAFAQWYGPTIWGVS